MNDADFELQCGRIDRLKDTWAQAMGVRNKWHLGIQFFREPLDTRPSADRARPPECENAQWGRVMQITPQWQYQHADLEVNCLLMARMGDQDLTVYFLHELGHMYLAGLATLAAGKGERVSHAWYLLEEYTATELAWSWKWLADDVWKDGLDGVYTRAEPDALAWNG